MSLLSDQRRRLQERLECIEDSKIFQDPNSPSIYDCACVPHQAQITSSSRKPSREVWMPRNTRENMSIPGTVFDRQHARRDSDELHNDSRNLAISLAILRTEGIDNGGSEEPLQSIPLLCLSVRARRKSLDGKWVLCLWLTMPRVLGVLKAWQFRVISPRRCICKIPWPNGISELSREFPSRNLRGGEESRARIAVDQENRSSQLAEGPHQSKINYGKRFLWLRRIRFDDGGRIEMMLRYGLFDLRNSRA